LIIGNQKITEFEAYNVEANLFNAENRFEVVLANTELRVSPGEPLKLYVNDQLETTGIIQSRSKSLSIGGKVVTLAGTDLMGLLSQHYVEEFITLENYTLTQLATLLISKVPFINVGTDVIYGKGDRARAAELTATEEDYTYQQIEPGDTVFDVLKKYATSRGYLFFSLPNGKIVFDQPVKAGPAVFSLVNRRGDARSNIINVDTLNDIEKRFSKVTVFAQSQMTDDDLDVDERNAYATVMDPTFPFYKPFFAEAIHDGQNLAQYAALLMDRCKFDAFNLTVTTYGHSQNGKNFTVNAICHVDEEDEQINRDMLIYSRTFTMDKEQGAETVLMLSDLGVFPT